jgi:putative flippase GtrA
VRLFGSARQFASYAVIGVVNTGVYNGTFLLGNLWLHYLLAHCVGVALAVVVSFVLNSVITYRVPPTWRGFLRFPLSSLFNLVVAGAVLQLGVTVFHMREDLAALIGGVLVTPLSFLLSRWALMPKKARQTRQGSTGDSVMVSTR